MKHTIDIFARARMLYQNKHEPERLQVIARVYWHVSLTVVFVLLTGAVVFATFMLMSTLNELNDRGDMQRQTAPILTREQLMQVLTGFSERQARFDDLQKHPRSFADPSR